MIVSITFVAADAAGSSNVATSTIRFSITNQTPVAAGENYTVTEDTPLTIAAPGVLANDSDANSDPLTASIVTPAGHGTAGLNADGSFTYTPNANFDGSDSFTYRAYDGTAFSNTATVGITVTAVNDTPVAANDNYTVNEDTALIVPAAGVLTNDSDVEGDALAAVLVSGPSHGSLTLNANGSFTYTPTFNFNGSDSFTYCANDGALDSTVTTVVITVNSVNDPPAASNLNAAETYVVNTPLNLTNIVVSDVDSPNITAHLTLSVAAAGTLSTATSGAVTSTYDGTTGVWLASGAIADVNTLLANITFTPANNYSVRTLRSRRASMTA